MKKSRLVPFLLLGTLIPSALADDLTVAARATPSDLIQRLGAALKKEIGAGGPDNAIAVCRDVAPALSTSGHTPGCTCYLWHDRLCGGAG